MSEEEVKSCDEFSVSCADSKVIMAVSSYGTKMRCEDLVSIGFRTRKYEIRPQM